MRQSVFALHSRARIVDAASARFVDNGERLRHPRVRGVEEEPTVTRGGVRDDADSRGAVREGDMEVCSNDPKEPSMNLYEYQARALLAESGIPVPEGEVARTAREARAIAERIGGLLVIKAQVHAGGRRMAVA